MIKLLLLLTALLFTSCINKSGISMNYYNDCKEYYDLQGFYHKDCKDEIVTYREIKETGTKIIDTLIGEEKEPPKPNVW